MIFKLKVPNNLKFKKYNKKFGSKFNRSEFRVSSFSKNFNYGLLACESKFVTMKQISTAYSTISKYVKSKSLRKFKNLPLRTTIYARMPKTFKSSGVRMGKGKGKVDTWGFFVKKNRLIFELGYSVNYDVATKALLQSKVKFPLRTKIITRFLF